MLRALRRASRGLLRRTLNRYAPPDVVVAMDYVTSRGRAAFPARNIVVTSDVPVTDVLVLSPHPDDEVIGMGGTLHMHATNGSRVTVLYLTDGAGLGPERGDRVARRRREAESVGRLCGFEQLFWEHEDTRLTNDADTVSAMAELIRALEPSLIYLPSFFDRHYDHFSTNAVLADALRTLPGADATVLGYEVWDNVPFQNHVVDVSRHFESKKELMQHYRAPLEVTDFTALFAHRGAVHYLLYVDSRREHAVDRYAEAFCRLDAASFVSLFDDYVEVLAAHRSPMLEHLSR